MAGSILIVEDDPSLREVLMQTLTDEGYFVVGAKDGAEAISLLHLVKYNLVLLDLNIPRVDGSEVASMIRGLAMRTPIVIMSGDSQARRLAINLDIEAFLTKPFDMPVLLSVVEDCVKRSLSANIEVPLSL